MAKSSGSTRGSSWRAKPQSIESILGKITESGFYDDYNGSLQIRGTGRTLQGYIASVIGRDGSPKLVSDEEFQRLSSQKGKCGNFSRFSP